jgi:transcriptional regulator with XRE-family HTH domain
MKFELKELPLLIKSIRFEQQLHQNDFAIKCGFNDQQYISNMENGRKPITLKTLEKICEPFGHTIEIHVILKDKNQTTKKMNNFKNITNIDYRCMVSMKSLIDLGWNFDDIIYFEVEKNGLTFREAEVSAGVTWDVELKITGTPQEYHVGYVVYDANNHADFSDSEASGDNQKSVEDIETLIKKNQVYKAKTYDLSINSSGDYTPTFLEN